MLAFAVSLIFQVFFAPNSHTLINGFTSVDKPTSLERLPSGPMPITVMSFFGAKRAQTARSVRMSDSLSTRAAILTISRMWTNITSLSKK